MHFPSTLKEKMLSNDISPLRIVFPANDFGLKCIFIPILSLLCLTALD